MYLVIEKGYEKILKRNWFYVYFFFLENELLFSNYGYDFKMIFWNWMGSYLYDWCMKWFKFWGRFVVYFD